MRDKRCDIELLEAELELLPENKAENKAVQSYICKMLMTTTF